ncbi:MAG: YkgB family protein [Burkholderiales bacterium]
MNNTAPLNPRSASLAGIERNKAHELTHPDAAVKRIGEWAFRYGLALVFLWIGLLKFTEYEAKGLEPLLMNSPIWSAALQSLGLRMLSNCIGVIEIAIGLMIASRAFWPRVSALGSVGAVVTFLVTLSFMVTTPGVWQAGYGVGYLSPMPGQFLLKDVVLLGVSIWTAGEAYHAGHR